MIVESAGQRLDQGGLFGFHPAARQAGEPAREDFTDFAPLQDRLRGYDACFFCLGTSALGMSETDYRAVTYDLTLAVAHTVLAANPALTFCYVSGAGTDAGGA